MSRLLTLAACLLAAAAHSQTITSLNPAANSLAVPRSVPVIVTLTAPAAPGTTLRVFSSLVGGRKPGTLTLTGNTVRFTPATAFMAGETLTVVFTSASVSRMWQFTAAATGTGYFSGGFDLPVTAYPSGSTLLSIAAGDLTGDGNVDIMGRETGTNPSSLFAGSGTGQLFHHSYQLDATSGWRMLPPIGDLNGDGLLDLGYGLNGGNGTFTYPTLPTTYPSEYDGILADVDSDGDLDYAFTANQALYVYTNTGNGTLAATGPGVSTNANGLLSAGDFDGDGDVDLALYSMRNSGSLSILRNNGQGLFAVAATYTALTSPSFYSNHTVAVGDLDGDGDLDLVVPMQVHLNSNTGLMARSVDFWLNDGQGNFTATPSTNWPTSGIGLAYSVALGDLDGDGDLDLLTATNSVQIYCNTGNGTFTAGYTLPNLDGSGGVLLADMNSDGSLDVVAAKPGTTPGGTSTGTPGVLSVRLNGYTLATQPAWAADVRVWPNPVVSGGRLHVGQMPVGTTVTLYNLLGQRVTSTPLTGPAGELPTSGLAPGVYVLTLQPRGQSPLTYRIAVE